MFLRPDNEDLAPKALKIPNQKTIIDEMGNLSTLKPIQSKGEAPGKKLGDIPLDRAIVSQKMQKKGLHISKNQRC